MLHFWNCCVGSLVRSSLMRSLMLLLLLLVGILFRLDLLNRLGCGGWLGLFLGLDLLNRF
jgi:hypothetical protein